MGAFCRPARDRAAYPCFRCSCSFGLDIYVLVRPSRDGRCFADHRDSSIDDLQRMPSHDRGLPRGTMRRAKVHSLRSYVDAGPAGAADELESCRSATRSATSCGPSPTTACSVACFVSSTSARTRSTASVRIWRSSSRAMTRRCSRKLPGRSARIQSCRLKRPRSKVFWRAGGSALAGLERSCRDAADPGEALGGPRLHGLGRVTADRGRVRSRAPRIRAPLLLVSSLKVLAAQVSFLRRSCCC